MSLPLAHLIATHGYWVAFAGSLLEGETVLALAGLAAHRGYLSLPALIAIGAVGGFLGDQIGFAVGRRLGGRLLERFPRLEPAVTKMRLLVERHPRFSVIAVRFLYGMRIAGPVVIGASRLHWATFALLNASGATLWSACWVGAGFVAGTAVEAALGELKRVEHVLFAVALSVAIAASLWLRVRRRRVYAAKSPRAMR